MYFIKLIRPLNLFIIALTAVSSAYLIGARSLYDYNLISNLQAFHDQFHVLDFALLILTMIFSAAAGNIINDYFDVRADRINKPHQMIIGKHIKRRWAILVHWIFNLFAVVIAAYLGWKYTNVWFFLFPFLSTVILWFYSVFLKKKILWGNLAIAFLSSAVPFLTGIFLMEFFIDETRKTALDIFWFGESIQISLRKWIWFWMLFLSGTAFALTLIREIVKDIADVDGDKAIQCKTLPIKYGVRKTLMIVVGLHFLITTPLALLAGKVIVYSNNFSTYFSWVIWIMIIAPLILSLILSLTAKGRLDYVKSGQIIKMSMLGGLILMGMI